MQTLPLVGHDALGRPVAWRDGAPVSVARFLAEVEHLAAALPAGAHVMNLCEDRYRFAVVLAATLLAGKTTLLPPNRTERALVQVGAAYAGCGAVTDAPLPPLDAPVVDYPDVPPHARGPAHVPAIAADHPAAVVFTSGSTGEPRPNLKRWGKLAAGARAEGEALGLAPSAFNLLGTVPPQHMYGLESTVLLPLLLGGAMHPARPLLAADVRAGLAALPAPRVLVTTPIHVRACVEGETALPALCVDRVGRGTARAGACGRGRAPLRDPRDRDLRLQRGWNGRHPPHHGDADVAHDVGHPPRARRARLGVHRRPRARPRPHLRPAASGERHGVPARGRARDMLNIAGKRASLGDLNHKLLEIPGVQDGVFHVPQGASDGQVARLMAFVVAPALTEGEIIDALRRAIDPAFLPRPLVKVAALPRASTGKLPLEALRLLEAEAAR
ncbi:MAG: AMP-binding protein [Burkholderiales bacterium]|nr:AMP-binding protein [Burkholderiales bacterium]